MAANLNRVMPAIRLAGSLSTTPVNSLRAAEACGMSRSGFFLVFRQTMGLSFAAFSRRVRLSRVAQLLRQTELSVEAIAIEMGFVDGSHLSRLFARSYGVAPGRYRKQHQHAHAPSGDGAPSPGSAASGAREGNSIGG